MVTTQSKQKDTLITLMSNCSVSKRQTNLLIAGVSLFVIIIAVAWGFMGAAFVLPFAGIDVILFAYFMHKVCNDSHQKQVITIDDERILFQSGRQTIERSAKLERPSAYISVAEVEGSDDNIVLKLTDSKARYELGAFLSQEDKVEMRLALRQAGLREINEKWWKR